MFTVLSALKVDNGDDIQPWINRCLKLGGQWVLGGRIRLRVGGVGGETRAACSDGMLLCRQSRARDAVRRFVVVDVGRWRGGWQPGGFASTATTAVDSGRRLDFQLGQLDRVCMYLAKRCLGGELEGQWEGSRVLGYQ